MHPAVSGARLGYRPAPGVASSSARTLPIACPAIPQAVGARSRRLRPLVELLLLSSQPGLPFCARHMAASHASTPIDVTQIKLVFADWADHLCSRQTRYEESQGWSLAVMSHIAVSTECQALRPSCFCTATCCEVEVRLLSLVRVQRLARLPSSSACQIRGRPVGAAPQRHLFLWLVCYTAPASPCSSAAGRASRTLATRQPPLRSLVPRPDTACCLPLLRQRDTLQGPAPYSTFGGRADSSGTG